MGYLIQASKSGIYTPIVSNETNGITVDATNANYIRVGNIVNCFIRLEITMDSFQNDGTFQLSLPVVSNFTNPKDLLGLMQWSVSGVLANIENLSIFAETTNNTCFVDLQTLSTGSNMQYCILNIQYQII
jgi:hypothetical protein